MSYHDALVILVRAPAHFPSCGRDETWSSFGSTSEMDYGPTMSGRAPGVGVGGLKFGFDFDFYSTKKQ